MNVNSARISASLVLTLLASPAYAASVRGRVLDDVRHQPIERVRLTLSGAGLASSIVSTSGVQGEFVFPGLSRGVYRLSADKAGYFNTAHGDIEVQAESDADLREVILTVSRSISGIVRWQNGEPVSGASVRVMVGRAGSFTNLGGSTANDRGEFRIEGLRGGRYILYTYAFPYEKVAVGAPLRSRQGRPAYFPGPDARPGAATIDLRDAGEYSGVSIVLQERPAAVVTGLLAAPSEVPAGAATSVTLLPVDNLWATPLNRPGKLGEPFEFPAVPEGEYLLMASAGAYRFAQRIQVTGAALRDLRIALEAGVALTGKVEIEDAMQSPSITPAANLLVMPRYEPQGNLQAGPQRSNAVGEFAIPGLRKGETYRMEMPGLAAGLYVVRVRQGTREISGGPPEVVAGAGPVEILLRKDAGKIDGHATRGGNPVGEAFVVLAPKNRKAVNWYRTATSRGDGWFRLADVVPGEYDLIAFRANEEDSYLDPEYLTRFAARWVSVRLEANTTVLADVELPNEEAR